MVDKSFKLFKVTILFSSVYQMPSHRGSLHYLRRAQHSCWNLSSLLHQGEEVFLICISKCNWQLGQPNWWILQTTVIDDTSVCTGMYVCMSMCMHVLTCEWAELKRKKTGSLTRSPAAVVSFRAYFVAWSKKTKTMWRGRWVRQREIKRVECFDNWAKKKFLLLTAKASFW